MLCYANRPYLVIGHIYQYVVGSVCAIDVCVCVRVREIVFTLMRGIFAQFVLFICGNYGCLWKSI